MSVKMDASRQITEGVIWKQLLIFFFPIMLGSFFQQLYNTVDTVVVGQFVGKEALAAVGGSSAQIASLIVGFFTGLSSGASVIIAHFFGARDRRSASKAVHNAYVLAVAGGIVLTVLGILLTPHMLSLMNTPEATMGDAVLYLRIYFGALTFTFIYNMGASILRAAGNSRTPLYYLIVCCFLNIVLDLFTVVVLNMGIAGAAIATVISQAVSAALVTRSLMKSYDLLKLRLRAIRIHPDLLRAEFRIGLPGGLQSCAYSISNIIIQAAINNFGTDTAAAWAAFGKMDAIFWTISGSFGITIATFAGQNFGARRFDRIQKSVRVCLAMALGLSCVLLVFLFVCCRPLYYAFTTDPSVIDIGVYMLRLITPSYIIYIFVEIFSGALRGIGDVLIPTTITMGGVLLIRLSWILFVTPMTGELSTLLYSYPLAWGATALFLLPYYFRRKKKLLA